MHTHIHSKTHGASSHFHPSPQQPNMVSLEYNMLCFSGSALAILKRMLTTIERDYIKY
jgi:hypothetical protein